MAAFEYEAFDTAGTLRTGVISADSARLARRELRQIRLVPLKVAPVKSDRRVFAGGPAWMPRSRVSPRTLMITTRQLATMVGAAAPLEEALHTIALQAEDKAMRAALLSVRVGVTEGSRLADAMAQHPHIFNALYRAFIGAGEISGNLGAVLERLAEHLEKSERLRGKVSAALIYPLVLSAVALGVIVILMTFVVPKVVAQFDSMGQQLPGLTRGLIFVSDAMAAYGLVALILLALAGGGFAWLLRKPLVRRRVDGFVLRIPVIGKLLRGLYAARLTRTLGTLIASGSPIVDGLGAAKATVSNVVIVQAIEAVTAAITEGSSLSSALRRAGLFPPMVVYMSAVGESTGRLDDMLTRAAEHLESEFESFTTTAIGLLEPLIVVLMGGVVALIILAILMPILQLNSLALL